MSRAADKEDFLNKLKEGDEVKITVLGRKTKKRISVIVWFLVERGKVLLVPVRGSRNPWFRNLERDPWIQLTVGAASVQSKAEIVRDPKQVEDLLARFREKYSSSWSDSYYPGKHDVFVEVPVG